MTPVTRDPELERFKVEIDLRAYARDHGYVLDRKESWRGSAVMRLEATDDKIIISRDIDGHYVYFSVRDDADNGSIIDFVLKRQRCSLGHVRMALRPWIGRLAEALREFKPLGRRTDDRLTIDRAFWRMLTVADHPYLVQERRIPLGLLTSGRFAGRVRIDDHGNAILPHFDQEGLCGYEIKNRGFTGFSGGGTKGLWFSHTEALDTHLVIAEGAIDAMSYAALFPSSVTRYASTGGKMSPHQSDLVTATVKRLGPGATVVAATDNDNGGTDMVEALRHAVGRAERPDVVFIVHRPEENGADWNDVLQG